MAADPLNVMLVTNEYPPAKIAGTAMSTHFLAEELTSRGHEITVVVNARGAAAPHEVIGNLSIFRLRPLELPLTRMLQRASMLTDLARRVRPDVIQGQSISCGALAVAAGRRLRIPTVTYVQGLDLYQSTPWARKTYVRWALTKSDAIAAVTPDLQSRVLALAGRHAEVIPHGLRLHRGHDVNSNAARTALGLPSDAKIILFVGRLIAIKGVEHLVRATRRVLDQCPGAHLVIVGDGPERPRLAALAGTLGVAQRVSFAGLRSHEDVMRFMRAADLFVLPSLVESFGMVLVEAMSCGLPIVASAVMGIPSVVEDGMNGSLVPPGNESALVDRVVRLLADASERAAMSRRNVEKARGYAIQRIADRFLELWGRLACGQA